MPNSCPHPEGDHDVIAGCIHLLRDANGEPTGFCECERKGNAIAGPTDCCPVCDCTPGFVALCPVHGPTAIGPRGGTVITNHAI
jgi:hypothetical protein